MKTFTTPDDCTLPGLEAPCFRDLLPEEISLARESKTMVVFHKGETLAKQGAFASSVLFIIDGLGKRYVEGDALRNYNISLVKSGEFIGLSAAFGSSTYPYSVTALSQVTACLIEKDAVASLAKMNGVFAHSIISRYCQGSNLLYSAISKLTNKQMNGRMAEALLYLDAAQQEGQQVFVNLSRKDLSDFAGVSTESAIKLLKNFEKDGLIRLEDKDIRLLDRQALEEISRKG